MKNTQTWKPGNIIKDFKEIFIKTCDAVSNSHMSLDKREEIEIEYLDATHFLIHASKNCIENISVIVMKDPSYDSFSGNEIYDLVTKNPDEKIIDLAMYFLNNTEGEIMLLLNKENCIKFIPQRDHGTLSKAIKRIAENKKELLKLLDELEQKNNNPYNSLEREFVAFICEEELEFFTKEELKDLIISKPRSGYVRIRFEHKEEWNEFLSKLKKRQEGSPYKVFRDDSSDADDKPKADNESQDSSPDDRDKRIAELPSKLLEALTKICKGDTEEFRKFVYITVVAMMFIKVVKTTILAVVEQYEKLGGTLCKIDRAMQDIKIPEGVTRMIFDDELTELMFPEKFFSHGKCFLNENNLSEYAGMIKEKSELILGRLSKYAALDKNPYHTGDANSENIVAVLHEASFMELPEEYRNTLTVGKNMDCYKVFFNTKEEMEEFTSKIIAISKQN